MPVIENSNAEPGMTDVVAGIVSDFQKLIAQQIALFRAEVSSDFNRAKRAIMPMVAGGLVSLVGVILLGFTIAYLIHWAVSPTGTDPGRLPLWGCFGIATIGFLGVGLALIAAGAKTLQSSSLLPNESARELSKNVTAIADAAANGPVHS